MLSSDQFTGIQAFIETAQAGSFTLAAQRLDLTRSAVGKAVARLERRLGVRLFHRSTRRLALTEEGQAYLAHCIRAMDAFETAETDLLARRGAPRGRVRIALPVLFGRHRVLPVLVALAERHPGLHFDLRFSSERSDLQEEGIDLAVRIGELRDEAELVARPLGMQRTQLCAAPGYLLARGVPVHPDDLPAHDGIAASQSPVRWALTDASGHRHIARPTGRWRSSDTQAMRDLVLAGHGLALLPQWLAAPHLQSGALAAVLDGWQGPALPIHALWPQGGPLPLRVRTVIDALVEAFEQPAAL
ncbi:MAG: LysR substrate-binding domain-containing protein [Pseudomonadota bacterium]